MPVHPMKELRESIGLKQYQMAEEVGLSAAYVSQVENRVWDLGRDAGLKVVTRFRPEMNRLGITLEDLLRGTRSRGAA